MPRILGDYYWRMEPGVVVGDCDCCYSFMRVSDDPTVTLSGVLPLTYTAKGQPLIDYTVYGNAVQASTSSPDNPVEVQAVGDKTGNLLNFEDLLNAPEGMMPDNNITLFPHILVLHLKPNTTYTCSSNGTGNTTSTPVDLYRSLYFCSGNANYSVNVDNSVTYTTDSTGLVRIGFFDERANSQQYLNKTAYIMLNEGETALPYEPYGYKIPFTTAAEDGSESITTTAYLDKPLYKIGDYADTLCYAEQKVDRVVRENILTGNEDWRLQSINSNGIANFYFYPNGTTPSFVSDNFVLSSHFEQQNTTIANTNSEGVFLANRYIVYIRVKQERASTITDFKSYLAAQYAAGTPVKIYYVLQTPESESVELPKLPTLSGANFLNTDTTVRPSNITITGKGLAEITDDPVMTDLLAIMEGMDE